MPNDLPLHEKQHLIDFLLECPTISDTQGRSTVVRQLPRHIANAIQGGNGTPRVHVTNIVDACMNHAGGLDALVGAVRSFDGRTRQFQTLNTAFADKIKFTDKIKNTKIKKSFSIWIIIALLFGMPKILIEFFSNILNNKTLFIKLELVGDGMLLGFSVVLTLAVMAVHYLSDATEKTESANILSILPVIIILGSECLFFACYLNLAENEIVLSREHTITLEILVLFSTIIYVSLVTGARTQKHRAMRSE